MSFYLISNWKMNGSIAEIDSFLNGCMPLTSSFLKAVICPPFPFLQKTLSLLPDGYFLGAQDCSAFQDGAYTGQVSAGILQSVGCSYVLIGHCERRAFESQEEIIAKKDQAQKAGLTPVVCIGEKKSQDWKDSLTSQIEGLGEGHFFLAYEPVWAVGKSLPFDEEHVQQVFHFLAAAFPQKPLLYGGAVTSVDLKKIRQIGFSGVLLGRAGRDVSQWNCIISECSQDSSQDS